jgi:hypothetical protein
LKFASFLAEKNISISILRQDEESHHDAIGILLGYAFITKRSKGDSFDVHQLLRRLIQLQLKESSPQEHNGFIKDVIEQLAKVYPSPEHQNRETWIIYLPHTQAALDLCKGDESPTAS